MSTLPFTPPVFPGTVPREHLKPTTQARLRQQRGRVHSRPLLAHPLTLTRWEPKVHSLDVLLHWWMVAQRLDEHLDILGSVAASPIAFVQSYAGCDLTFIHTADIGWQQGRGVVAVFWSSDVVPLARYRLDYWVDPGYRHPHCTAQIATGILTHLFTTRQFQLVWGITPVTNRLALRLLWRLGYRTRQRWPGATIDPRTGHPLDAVVTLIPRAEWQARQEGGQGGDQ